MEFGSGCRLTDCHILINPRRITRASAFHLIVLWISFVIYKACSCFTSALLICELISFAGPSSASAHGFAGDRFFPATITTDDPFAASELSLPTVSVIRQPGDSPIKDIDISADISVQILPKVALSLGDGYQIQKAANQRAITGFDNAEA